MFNDVTKKLLVFPLVFFALLLGAVSFRAYATDYTTIDIPEDYLDGRRCPPAPSGDLAVCGTVRSIQREDYREYERTGQPIKGVYIVAYMGKENGELTMPQHDVWTNAEGEYFLNIRKYQGYKGLAYVGFFCHVGQEIILKDMYAIDTTLDIVPYLNISIDCESRQPDTTIFPPPNLGFIDRDGFLICGESKLAYQVPSEPATATDTITLQSRAIDSTYNGNVFDPTSLSQTDVPPATTQPAQVPYEGRHEAEIARTPDGDHSFINSFNTGFNPITTEKQYSGQVNPRPLPPCDQSTRSNSTTSDGVYNSYVTQGIGLGLMDPVSAQMLYNAIDLGELGSTPICRLPGGGVKTFIQFELGDPDFPYSMLFRMVADQNLQKSFVASDLEYRAEDSGFNFETESDEEEDCRVETFTDDIGDRPFKACSSVRQAGVAEALRFMGTYDEEEIFSPLYLLADPTVEDGVMEVETMDRLHGIFRVGVPAQACACSTIDPTCEAPTPEFPVETNDPHQSGYVLDNNAGSSWMGDSLSFASIGGFFANIIATFQVWAGNVLDVITGGGDGGECVSRAASSTVVDSCSYGSPICERIRECENPATGIRCTVEGPDCVCDTYYRKYDFVYECNGVVSADLIVNAEIKNDPGQDIGAASEFMYRAFADPIVDNSEYQYKIGGIDFADQAVTFGTNNEAAAAAEFIKSNSSNSATTYGDALRNLTMPVLDYEDDDLYNPREYPYTVLFEPVPGEIDPEDVCHIPGPRECNPRGHAKGMRDALEALRGTYMNPDNPNTMLNVEVFEACYCRVTQEAAATGNNDAALAAAFWVEESGASNYSLADEVLDFGCGRIYNDFFAGLECVINTAVAGAYTGFPLYAACTSSDGDPGVSVREFMAIYAGGTTCAELLAVDGGWLDGWIAQVSEIYSAMSDVGAPLDVYGPMDNNVAGQ